MCDWLPVVSQFKSLIQVCSGDAEGARKTQEKFLRQCPIVSQGTSFVYSVQGNEKEALQVQKECGEVLLGVVEGTPIVGHVVGTGYYIAGNKEGGDRAMKTASRTTGVMIAGGAGFVVGGPAGAVAGGILGGAAMDGITTGVESGIHGEYRPNGNVALVTDIVTGKVESTSGAVTDLVFAVTMDGVAGYGAGKALSKAIDLQQNGKVYRVMDSSAATESVQTQQLPPGHNAVKNGVQTPMGETWVSESATHSKGFSAEETGRTEFKTVQVKLPKAELNAIKADAIPQKGSAAMQTPNAVKNVFNTERLSNHPQGKVNIGIKGPDNLQVFNESVVKTKIIDPNSLQYQNGVTKGVSRFGKASAAMESTTLVDSSRQAKTNE